MRGNAIVFFFLTNNFQGSGESYLSRIISIQQSNNEEHGVCFAHDRGEGEDNKSVKTGTGMRKQQK